MTPSVNWKLDCGASVLKAICPLLNNKLFVEAKDVVFNVSQAILKAVADV